MFTRLRKIRPTGFVAGFLAAIIVSGTGVAYAASGGNMLIGRNNYASSGTGLSNSAGSALYLGSKAGTPPMVVYSTVKVPRLNADALDGLDNTAFALTSGQTGYIKVDGTWADVNGDGVDDVLIATASCPAGTKLVGGGADNWTGNDTLVDSPGSGGTWWAASLADPSMNQTSDLSSYAECYNPRGAVPGATTVAPSTTKTAQTPLDMLRDKVAAHLKK